MKMNQPIFFLAAIFACSTCPWIAFSEEPSRDLKELQFIHEVEMTEKVTNPFNDGIAKLNIAYLSGLERELAAAKAAADLDSSLALDAEIKRLASHEVLPDDNGKPAAALERLRTIYRSELSKLESKRRADEATLLTPYLSKLKDLEVRLTKAGDLEDARTVQLYRIGLTADRPESDSDSAMASTPDSDKKPDSAPKEPMIGQKTTVLPAGGFSNPATWEAMGRNPAGLKVVGQKSKKLREGLTWGKYLWSSVPQKLVDHGAEVYFYEGFANGLSEFEVLREGWLIIGVNYSYQGNSSGDWEDERWDLDKFQSEGWQLIDDNDAGGSLTKDNEARSEKRSQTLLTKFVKEGETLSLRCNKYDPPFLIVLGR